MLLRAIAATSALVVTTSLAFAASEELRLDGYAEWRAPGVLVVDGQRVIPADGLRFDGDRGARSFESIPLGYEVRARGARRSDGVVVAREVEASRNGTALFETDLREAFDETEAAWRRRGRVLEAGPDGKWRSLGELRAKGRAVDRVRRITRRLAPPYQDADSLRVYVVENDAWNAMAAPNGSIYVFRGLLDAMDDDELAIIVGHELAHVTHEHARKQHKRGLWTSLVVTGGLGALQSALGGDTRGQLAGTAAVVAASAFTNRYSRGHEDQADRVGLRYAHEAGFDVRKAPALWRRFARRYGGGGQPLNFLFGGHSTAASRARNLEREIHWNYE